jgi:ketopantoate reductase
VLTLQNGVDSAEDVAARLGDRQTLGGSTYIATAIGRQGSSSNGRASTNRARRMFDRPASSPIVCARRDDHESGYHARPC